MAYLGVFSLVTSFFVFFIDETINKKMNCRIEDDSSVRIVNNKESSVIDKSNKSEMNFSWFKNHDFSV